jgi:HlyD family secretion protein
VVAIVVGYLIFGRGAASATEVRTPEVTRGDLTVTVTATGNLEPRNQVDIGSELSGTIRTFSRRERRSEGGTGADEARHDAARSAGAAGAELACVGRSRVSCRAIAGLKEVARELYARLQKVRELSGNKLPRSRIWTLRIGSAHRAKAKRRRREAAVAQAKRESRRGQDRSEQDRHQVADQRRGAGALGRAGQTVRVVVQAPVLFTLRRGSQEDGAARRGRRGGHRLRRRSARMRRSRSIAFPNRQFHATITRVDFASNNTQKSSSVASSGVPAARRRPAS